MISMYGNTFTRSARAIGQMILHPHDGARWVSSLLARKSPIEMSLPWMSWRAVDYLRTAVRPGSRVFEWGGGGSTRFFVRRGCDVTTVESSAEWKQAIEAAVRADQGLPGGGALQVRLIPAETRDPKAVRDYIRAVHDGAPWDIVLVDGLEEEYLNRIDCIKEVAAGGASGSGVLREGGMVILDDAWRTQYRVVPDLLKGWRRLRFRSLGPARLGVTQTDVYFPPGTGSGGTGSGGTGEVSGR